MEIRLSRIASIALSLAALCVAAVGQSNLTAKVNSFDTPSSGAAVVETDRTRDGLIGPVRRVRTEIVKLSTEAGKLVEGKHAVLEIVAYDIKGNKTENQYFPVAGANLTGKEVYKYDDKGNISEMTLLNDDGSLLSKEVYKYEFDFAGNWNKMTSSVAVVEGGKLSFEPTEVTYRSIMYYLDEKMMKMAQQVPAPTAAVNNTASLNPDPKVSSNPAQPSPGNSSKKSASSVPASTVTSDQLKNLESTGTMTKPTLGVQTSSVQLVSEPPPPAAPGRILKPVSGGVLNGTAISLPAPTYPDAARRLRMSGVVVVEVIVDESGKVISARATSGPAGLKDVAVQAAMRARFSPTKLSGQPVKVSGLINYKFALAP
ncbi:MAG TPA: TonB family protein [Pyrinomonadaceae bacterium]|nr:TonB family protein [Pyrinomonadaceae bacterium]